MGVKKRSIIQETGWSYDDMSPGIPDIMVGIFHRPHPDFHENRNGVALYTGDGRFFPPTVQAIARRPSLKRLSRRLAVGGLTDLCLPIGDVVGRDFGAITVSGWGTEPEIVTMRTFLDSSKH